MNLTDIDLRLLRIFLAVVEARGVSNAQTVLGRDASTISKHLAQLEGRLGFRLCERGRSGFALTDEGIVIHRRTLELFAVIQRFGQDALSMQRQLSGPVRIALIDNLITDDACPLTATLRRFSRREHNQVAFFIDITEPARIEQAVLDNQSDIGIGIFRHRLQELEYLDLYQEQELLYASSAHPLAGMRGTELQTQVVHTRQVVREFLGQTALSPRENPPNVPHAWVSNIEAAVMLILAGSHIGFLPVHFARQWAEKGQLTALAPEHYSRASLIQAITRQNKRAPRPVLNAFLDDLRQEHKTCI